MKQRFFLNEDSGEIIVVTKELEKLVPIFGLEYWNSEEWESVGEEEYAHFEGDDFKGIIASNALSQVNGNSWQQLDEGKFRFSFDIENIFTYDELLAHLKESDGDECRIEWNGSNYKIITFISEGNCQYKELELEVDTDSCIDSQTYNVGTDYLYQDSKSKIYYLGHTTRFSTDLFEKLEEWEPNSSNIEEIKEEFQALVNDIIL